MHQWLKQGVIQYISDRTHSTMMVILSKKIDFSNEKNIDGETKTLLDDLV